MDLNSIRREYKFSGLRRNEVNKNPVKQFEKWFEEAMKLQITEPTAMSVITLGLDGFPRSRIVLLKNFDENGFVFFTNYKSAKGKSIDYRPEIGLHFFWPEMERQIHINGYAEKTSSEISDKYFYSRPVKSQIAAIVSEQSTEIHSKEMLLKRFEKIHSKMGSEPITRPDWWGGYRVKPVKIEFWQGGENRLHDRILYEKINETWKIKRLAP